MSTQPDFASFDGSLTSSSNHSVYSFTSSEVSVLQHESAKHESSTPSSHENTAAVLPDLEALTPSALDAIPFRAQKNHYHATWARTFRSRPELYIRPQSIEEIQKIVVLARRHGRRLVVIGAGHSPSDLTCTSAWQIHLGDYKSVLNVKHEEQTSAEKLNGKSGGVALLQAGITLHGINESMSEYGLTMPNLGSIDIQSIAGAIATATHGSSLQHGLLSGSVRSLRIVLADGSAVWCSPNKRSDLFRAALVSLGCLGIVTEVEFSLVRSTNIEWSQEVITLDNTLARWEQDLWTQKEYVRCWWMPYGRKTIMWTGEKTTKPLRAPKQNFYGGAFGYHLYHTLLWAAHHVPAILPAVEWFVFGLNYRFSPGHVTDAVEIQREGLLMDCLFSQFVNEWALPLHHGPEALRRLDAWLYGDEATARIPFSSKGVYVHCPVEVRVTAGNDAAVRGFLDPTMKDGPTLYLNATLYRPYGLSPPCKTQYYKAFEYLMRELGGRPHWAKNFETVSQPQLQQMYGEDMDSFLNVRKDVDADGMFVSAWHRRNLLGDGPSLRLEEKEVARRPAMQIQTPMKGGMDWFGEQAHQTGFEAKRSISDESFDLVEAE